MCQLTAFAAESWPRVVVGGTTRAPDTALILGPVSPEWSGAEFCKPLVNELVDAGYRVVVADSISPLMHKSATSSEAILSIYVDLIAELIPAPNLIAGYAIGGTLAMALAERLPSVDRVLSLSGPGYMDPPLRLALGEMVCLLAQGNLDDCLTLLSHAVAPSGSVPNSIHSDVFKGKDVELAVRRMLRGFEVLLTLDVRPSLHGFNGRLLSLTGDKSQLATAENLGFIRNSNDRFMHAEVPGAGMRILLDNPSASLNLIKDWLTK